MLSNLIKLSAFVGLLILATMATDVEAICKGCNYKCVVDPANTRTESQLQDDCKTASRQIVNNHGGETAWAVGFPKGTYTNVARTYTWGGTVDFTKATAKFSEKGSFKNAKVTVTCNTCS